MPWWGVLSAQNQVKNAVFASCYEVLNKGKLGNMLKQNWEDSCEDESYKKDIFSNINPLSLLRFWKGCLLIETDGILWLKRTHFYSTCVPFEETFHQKSYETSSVRPCIRMAIHLYNVMHLLGASLHLTLWL